MIAYNKTLLNNLQVHKKAKQWFANGLLSNEQMAGVLNKYPNEYYKPNVFIKVGLFIFTIFLVSAAMGLYTLATISVIASSGSGEGYAMTTCFIFGGACIFCLERFIKWRNWYSNGIDDALLYCGLSFIFAFITFAVSQGLNDEDAFLLLCFMYLPFLAVAALRYLDRIVTIALAFCTYSIFFLLIMKMGSVAKFIMPFAFMALSAGIYVVVKKQMADHRRMNYMGCLNVLKAIAMIVFYISGNYFVIRESSIEFFGLQLEPGEDIPLALIFYAFTAFVPIGYLYFGLKRKDKLMVWVALLLIAVDVLTFKYYFSLGHPEVTLTIAGLIMIGLAYASIKHLASDKHGLTFKDDPNEDNFLKTNAEALIIAQSFGTTATPADTVQMGGGEFGGGGSGNKF